MAAAAAAVVCGGAAFLGVAAVTATIPLLCAAGLAATAAVAFLLGLPSFALAGARRRGRAASVFSCLVAVAVAGTAGATALRPLPVIATGPAPEAVRFWDLPTGSRIAYVSLRAAHPRPTPVIFLHGGPGTPNEGLPASGAELAALGFDVYSYDQLGAGRSTRLADVAGYTVARHVADLDAIRTTIGADKVILVGNSWGGSLAAQYMAAHPGNVAKAVFVSPGPVWEGAFPDGEYGSPWDRIAPERRARYDELNEEPRVLALFALMGINPEAAHALVPDAEADSHLHRLALVGKEGTGCAGGPPVRPHDNPQGFYVNQLTNADFGRIPDPRPVLRGVRVPSLVMRGECDYVAWPVTYDYRRTLPEARLVYLTGAGHAVERGQPERYLALLRAFLLDRPLPLPDHASAVPPK
ncbi:alpha/beta fold hydrolase [Streptosporangium carneum]|uniref:alpha/beta fold hydrolase n=1 Tax=Streptosporangium carneum TaxID=47481 RepID=UPI0022F2DACC|nr:alpha/beta fold hydrolase [Streptosporangium carneum]